MQRKYDFRVLLESVNGGKTSYYSSSFVNLDTDLVLSASQVYDRITGSYSCSYVNSSTTSSLPTGKFIVLSGSNDYFKDNKLLSASLSGSFSSPNPNIDDPVTNNEITGALDTGSIIFTALDSEYDRLLRYKFFGDKVCSGLGIPSEQWIYVDQLRLPADKESNYVEGNVKSKNIFVSDTFTFANTSNINSNIPILIRSSSAGDSDRYIKFVEIDGTPRNALLFGYDASASKYELTADDNVNFDIGLVDKLRVTVISGSDSVIMHDGLDVQDGASPIIKISKDPASNYASFTHNNKLTIRNHYDNDAGDIEFRTVDFDDAVYIDNSAESVGIGTSTPAATLHVAGGLKVDGGMTVVGAITSSIVSSSIMFSSGSNIFGDADTDQHTFNGSISASSNVRVTGDISASGDLYVVDDIFIGDRLEHIGDSNTHIAFTTDDIAITAGGVNVISTQNNGPDITLGTDSGNELELVLDNSNNRLLVKGDDNKIGLGNEVPTKKLTVEGAISASGDIFTEGTVSASNFYLTSSGEVVVQMGNTGDDLAKWEWQRNGVRKWVFFNDGRDGSPNPAVVTDALVIKHGISSDGNDHINMSFQQDDQTVYCHGDVSASGKYYEDLHHLINAGQTGSLLTLNAVTASHLARNSITQSILAENSTTASHLVRNSVTSSLFITSLSASSDIFTGIKNGAYVSASNGNLEISGSGTSQLIFSGSDETLLKVEHNKSGSLFEVRATPDSGSLVLSGSLLLRDNSLIPSNSGSRLYNTGSNLYYGKHTGMTPFSLGPKVLQSYSHNFNDDPGTIEHALPWADSFENSGQSDESVAHLCMTQTDVKHVLMRGQGWDQNMGGTIIWKIKTHSPLGTTVLTEGNWTTKEQTLVTLPSTTDNGAVHLLYARFSGSHAEPGDLLNITFQFSADFATAAEEWYIGSVVEHDYSTLPILGFSTGSMPTGSAGFGSPG
tara:strand:- start:4455 stop:7313 length:2859 start_codon:yes stop_codon:yes gene_type:complete